MEILDHQDDGGALAHAHHQMGERFEGLALDLVGGYVVRPSGEPVVVRAHGEHPAEKGIDLIEPRIEVADPLGDLLARARRRIGRADCEELLQHEQERRVGDLLL